MLCLSYQLYDIEKCWKVRVRPVFWNDRRVQSLACTLDEDLKKIKG